MDSIKVIIADDHPLLREGLAKVLSLSPHLQIVAVAGNGQEAVDLTLRHCPDVVLMDINMPIMNGVEATRVIKKEAPQVRILALTVNESEDKAVEVLRSGVSGYLLKDIEAFDLLSSIQAVTAGETVICPTIAAKLFRELKNLEPHHSPLEDLTEREIEVLKLIAQGVKNHDIAEQLFISEKTVKNHVSSIFRKIQVKDRTAAALFAIKEKLVDVDEH